LTKITGKKTMKITGKIIMGNMELPFVSYHKRPNMIRTEASLQGQKIIQSYDGKKGWMINPMMGSSDPIDMPSEEMKTLREEADFDGYLVNWKDKGNKLEYIGKENVEGADAFHLKVTMKDSTVRHLYLDADSYLEIQHKGKYPAQGKEIDVTTSLGGYKAVDGIMLPFASEGKFEGKTIQQMLVDSVVFDVPVPDTLFVKPKAKK
jgi:hypothetical protein